jgi:hypothetical protein
MISSKSLSMLFAALPFSSAFVNSDDTALLNKLLHSTKNSVAFSPYANYTDRATAALSADKSKVVSVLN